MFQALGWISRIQRRKLSLEPILIWETRQIMCNPFQRGQRYFWRHIIYICKVVIRVWEIVYNNRVNLQMHNLGVRVKRFRFFFFFSDKLLSNIHYNYLSSLGARAVSVWPLPCLCLPCNRFLTKMCWMNYWMVSFSLEKLFEGSHRTPWGYYQEYGFFSSIFC